ncbi:hypothetical protein HMPREF1138_1509 [Actinomyces sp. ICM58]|nr:hypothetical protein HMPREF1138_1509 [Actinomyces sp. ICM58]
MSGPGLVHLSQFRMQFPERATNTVSPMPGIPTFLGAPTK